MHRASKEIREDRRKIVMELNDAGKPMSFIAKYIGIPYGQVQGILQSNQRSALESTKE